MMFVFVATQAQQSLDVKFPKATIAGKSGGDITIGEIVRAGEVRTTNETLNVVRFAIVNNPGGAIIQENKTDNEIGTGMLAYIRSLTPGSKLCIDRVEAANNTGAVIKLEPVQFTIK